MRVRGFSGTPTPEGRFNSRSAAGGGGLLWRADENAREMFRILARTAAPGWVLERDNMCLVATGIPVAMFNPAFVPAGVDFDQFVEEARAFYSERGLPWALVVPEHDPVAPPGRIRYLGLAEAQIMPVMTRDTLPGDDWPASKADIDIQTAETDDVRADHRAVLAIAFGIPDHMSRIVLPPGVPLSPLLRFYVAYREGVPVGSAALCEAAGLAGIYNVATRPEYRRTGIATALMRHVLQDARERGLQTCVLQSSADGRPLYARLGFTRLSTYTIYTGS